MWVTWFFVSYLILALAIPLGWSLVPLWRRMHEARRVECPALAGMATVQLDPWFAVKMHARGDRELRVKNCSQWPEQCACGQECLVQIGATR
jgi:hypothetical protein